MSSEENDYESARQQNIQQNQALLRELGLDAVKPKAIPSGPRKKRRVIEDETGPRRTSARLASSRSVAAASTEPDTASEAGSSSTRRRGHSSKRQVPRAKARREASGSPPTSAGANVDAIVQGWTQWEPTGPAPTRDDDGRLHFGDWAEFTPNKTPAEILREGAFGGSFFRPLRSRRLGITVRDDWRELPAAWLAGLDAQRYVCGAEYDAAVNKFGVACGQSIEEWEASGWIAHDFDVRGWFQWYCRFFQGRRCDDDARQVARWARCVGARGRWRRVLLKQYVKRGIRSVMDEEGGEGGEGGEVSPVVSQTCFHWAWETRQSDLDAAWQEFG